MAEAHRNNSGWTGGLDNTMNPTNHLRPYLARAVVLAAVFAIYGFARLPEISSSECRALASRFSFNRLQLPELNGRPRRLSRVVHPDLERVSGWVSVVGAAVALNDLDGNGLPDDVCYVDARTDQVVVAPVPGTAQRYAPFELDPSPLRYDANTMAPMGCLPGDFNEDGLTDILVYYWGRTPIMFLRKPGAASPSTLSRDLYVPYEVMPGEERWYTNCATQADLDGDGHLDLILGNFFADNERILDSSGGGHPEMQYSMARAYNGGGAKILRWTAAGASQGPPVYQEVKGLLGDKATSEWTLAVGAADLDGDLLPELYFANDFGPDLLFHNLSAPGHLKFELLEGRKTFTTPNSKVLGRDSFKGMGVDFGDINGDGLPDIYVSNIAAEYALEESHFLWVSTGRPELMKAGIAPYEDRSESLGLSRSGWGWDCRLADFDNDGTLEALQACGFLKGVVNRWPELHEVAMGNDLLLHRPGSWPRLQVGDDVSGHDHDPLFVRASNGRYYDVAADIGMGDPQNSRGIAVADVNGDGRLDFAMANQWMPSYVFVNDSPGTGSFIGLHLMLPIDPATTDEITERTGHPWPGLRARAAIGASAAVRLPDGRQLAAQVDGGSGHSGKRSPDLHFGLGNLPDGSRLPVDIAWRDSFGQIHHQTITISSGWHTVLLGH
jgi:hypothetical protein